MKAFVIWVVVATGLGVAILLAPVPCRSPAAVPRELTIRKGILLADENVSADPCASFYSRVCGNFPATSPYAGTLHDLGYENRRRLTLPEVSTEGSGDLYIPDLDVELAPANGTLYAWVSTAETVEFVPLSSFGAHCIPEPLKALVEANRAFTVIGADLLPPCSQIPAAGPPDPTAVCANMASAQFLRGFDFEGVRAFVYRVRDFLVDWINASPSAVETKRQAIRRVRSIGVEVGGGRMVPDCSLCDTEIDESCVLERWTEIVALAGEPAQVFWGMGAFEANAYFSPAATKIFIPAGIARPPLYDASYPFQFNLGGLGSIIAHEFGHSIDLAGGRGFILSNRTAFASCVADAFVGVGQNESRSDETINENIADVVSALSIGPQLDQTGFEAFGQVWCKLKPADHTSGDPHSAARFRVDAAASISPSFSHTFGCEAPTACYL